MVLRSLYKTRALSKLKPPLKRTSALKSAGANMLMDILTHHNDDCLGASLMLQNRKGQKYVIGSCPEGLQRVLNQNKIKTAKLQAIFLTGQISWNSIGGLPGFLLTTTDQGVGKLQLYSGGNNLAYATNTWRGFMFHKMLDLEIKSPDSIFIDEFVAISPLMLTPYSEINGEKVNAFPKAHQPGLKDPNTPQELTSRDSRSTSYILQLLPVRGKFLPEKAIELGLPKGTLWGQLSKNLSVTAPDGRVITPEMVMDPPKTPPRIIVADIPTSSHLKAALEASWRDSIAGSEVEIDIKVVYHILGREVDIQSGLFKQWLGIFDSECLHYILHPDYSPNGVLYRSATELNCKLRQLFPENFVKPYSSGPSKQFDETSKVKLGTARTVTSLEPSVAHKSSPDLGSIGEVNWQRYGERLNVKDVATKVSLDETDEPQIITLGTGSAMPSKYRNVLSSLVRVPTAMGWTSIIFDAGEGTLNSMRRLYGPDTLERLLKEIKLLYISHLHADHHLGSVSIIRAWLEANADDDSKLYVFGPKHYHSFVKEWFVLEQRELNLEQRVCFLDAESYIVGQGYSGGGGMNSPIPNELDAELQRRSAIAQIRTCKAFHCEFSYSVAMVVHTCRGKFKISFSGDTRPNQFFARRVGIGSDVLIHEATHDNELAKEAAKKRHSTIGEALGIAAEMRAGATILTHFSQRYPKIPEMSQNEAGTAVAFDGMHMKVSQISKQHERFDQLQELFADVKDDEDIILNPNYPKQS